MNRNQALTVVFFIFVSICYGQNNFWVPTDNSTLRNDLNLEKREITPSKYTSYYFDFEKFISTIDILQKSFAMDIPMNDGKMSTFLMQYTPVFSPELAQKFPGFYSFTGKEVNGTAHIKFSVSPAAIHGMIFQSDGETIFIDPLTRDNAQHYQVYYKKDFKKRTGNFTCGLSPDHHTWNDLRTEMNHGARLPGDCQYRQYRLALACTGEYATFHGGTVDRVLSAFNATMTRVNGVFERELGVTMVLVPDTDKLIFFNASNDPYSNNNGSVMLGQNQTTVDNVIGRNNYDIGHVFSTAGGGIASLASVCTSRKAQGVTGQNRPVGDPFDIDFVAHEMGHQFGGNHTQNNNCQRNNPTAMEPGSASTIMGYAGICEPNVQSRSDDYFHAISLQEISNFIVAGQGRTCPEIISTDNEKPNVEVQKNSYIVPISTPFVLTAEATDNNGDNLTYCWEQMNNERTTMPPLATSTGGPNFRSFKPSSNPSRYFPELGSRNPRWEVLPSVSRNMSFRCTVRDNNSLYGCTDEVNVSIGFESSAGPFRIISPNSQGIQWQVGSNQTVTWNVANTDRAPINCAAVDIFLSTDGGMSFPHLIASNLPNNGSAQILIPNIATNSGRIMVKASDNIFFNVNGFNVRIVTSFSMETLEEEHTICDEASKSIELVLRNISNFSGPLLLNVMEKPEQILANISPSFFSSLPANSDLVLSQLNNLSLGAHQVKVQGVANSESQVLDINLFKYTHNLVDIEPVSPLKNQLNVEAKNLLFEWPMVEGVKSYRLQVSRSNDFSSLVLNVTTQNNFYTENLEDATVYYWRVEAQTPCRPNNWTLPFLFTTQGFADGSPIVVQKNPLYVEKDEKKAFTNVEINIAGENRDLIRFSLLNIPRRGTLLKQNVPLFAGQGFTMMDIEAGFLEYLHDGGAQERDSFAIQILDDKNRLNPSMVININVIQPFFEMGTQIQNITCHGVPNGKITILAFNGESPYRYSIDGMNFQNSNVFENLSAGSYSVYVRDASQTVLQQEVVLTEPEPIVIGVDNEFYEFIINASGGTGDLLFSINDSEFSSNNFLDNPENGLYTVQVKDFFNCISDFEFIVDIPTLTLEFEVLRDIVCFGEQAQIRLDAQGGFEPYSYGTLEGTLVDIDTILVAVGTHSFIVLDAGGKIVETVEWQSNAPEIIEINPQRTGFTYVLNGAGGTGPLTYSSDNINFVSNDTITFANNGLFNIYVKDSIGCQRTFNIRVAVLNRVSITQRDVKCYGGNDGFLNISPVNGQQPFLYRLNDGPYQSLNRWSNLKAGTYVYTVKDVNNDSLMGEVILSQPDSLYFTLMQTPNSSNILIEAFGGTPPYRYSLNGGDSFLDINQFSDLDEGRYDIVVRDNNGCLSEVTIFMVSSTKDVALDQIKIAPNPVKDYLSLTGAENIKVESLEIKNILGQTVYMNSRQNISEGIIEIDVRDMSPGLYILQVRSSQGERSLIWIKQ